MVTEVTPLKILQSRISVDINFVQVFPHQEDALNEYYDKHRDKKDVAIELPTGSGKTFVILAIAEFWLKQRKKVCVLAPNNQLMEQLLTEAKRLKLSSIEILKKNDDSIEASSNLRKYNFKLAFGITNIHRFCTHNLEADVILYDDSHLLEEFLDEEFSIKITPDLEQFEIIKSFLMEQGLLTKEEYDNIIYKDRFKLLNFIDESRVIELVEKLLKEIKDSNNKLFWSFYKNEKYLRNYFFFISSEGFLITPFVKPLSLIPQFESAKHRVFFSGTIPSKNQFIVSIGLATPLETIRFRSLAHYDYSKLTSGKRLILPEPTAQNIDIEYSSEELKLRRAGLITEIVKEFSKVLILCRSFVEVEVYSSHLKKTLDKSFRVFTSRDGPDVYNNFKSEQKAVLIVANRYSGMDFPSKTCEVTVLTTIPNRCNVVEKFIEDELKDKRFSQEKTALRLVQAFGRCNRSSNDLGLYIVLGAGFYSDFNQQKYYSKYYPQNIMNETYLGVEFYDNNKNKGFTERLKIGKKFLEKPEIFEVKDYGFNESPYDDKQYSNNLLIKAWEFILNNNFNDSQPIFQHLIHEYPMNDEYKRFFYYLMARCEFYRNKGIVNETVLSLLSEATKNYKTPFFDSLYNLLNNLNQSADASSPEKEHFKKTLSESLKNYQKLMAELFEIKQGLESNDHDAICEKIDKLLKILGVKSENLSKENKPDPDLLVSDIVANKGYVIEVKSKPTAELISSGDLGQLKKHLGRYDEDFTKVCYIFLSKKLPIKDDSKDQTHGINFQYLEDYMEFVDKLIINVMKRDAFIDIVLKFYKEHFSKLE